MPSPDIRIPVAVIQPSQSWLRIDWRSIVAYRDLLFLLVQRDFTSKYKQTILGPLWFILNPLVTTVVFTVIFNRVIGISTDGAPPLLFYLSGNLGWSFFSTVLGSTSNSLAGNAGLFSKVFFPRLIPPLATTISSGFALGIQFVTFLFLYFQHRWTTPDTTVPLPSFQWLFFLVLVVHMAMLGLGVGLIFSALTAKYRDLAHMQGFLVGIWMYATPIIYPLSRIPEHWQWLAGINPMTAIVEGTRLIFLGTGTFEGGSYVISFAVSGVLLLGGLFAYQYSGRTFIDTV